MLRGREAGNGGEDPSPGLAESGLLIIVPRTYQHIRCRLRRRSRNRTELADVNGDVPKEGFRTPPDALAVAWFRTVDREEGFAADGPTVSVSINGQHPRPHSPCTRATAGIPGVWSSLNCRAGRPDRPRRPPDQRSAPRWLAVVRRQRPRFVVAGCIRPVRCPHLPRRRRGDSDLAAAERRAGTADDHRR